MIGCFAAACVLLAALSWNAAAQIYRLPHPDTTAGNFFGYSTALDGDRALIGASGEDACGDNSGTAYIFERDSGSEQWHSVAQLVADDCQPEAFFGRSVALSGDRALVAASGEFFGAGTREAAYVFERGQDGVWRQTGKITMDTGRREGAFATAVALDGDRALITASGDPVHGRYNGAAYVFEYAEASGRWLRKARLSGSRGTRAGIFGGSAALDGDRAIVSASTYFEERPGSVYIFERDPGTGLWRETAFLDGIDDFFISVAIDGTYALVGESKAHADDSGEATLYMQSEETGRWRHAATLRPSEPYRLGAFGTEVSLQGPYALVVGFDEQLGFDFNIDRVVYVFKRDVEGGWKQHQVIDIGEVAFGAAVDFDDGRALIGNASERQAGAAYVVNIR